MALNKDDKLKALDAAITQIEKAYGKGSVMKLGDSKANMNIETVPTGSLSLDIALGLGGVPKGRIIEIYGPESSGKTTVALHMVAEVQKRGGIAGFIDAEHALDPVYAKNIGVDIDNLYISQPDNGEQALEITETMVRSGAVDIVIVDSVAALVPKAEIDGDMGDVGDGPVEQEEYHTEGLHYANAMYYENEGVKYYYFDLYAGEDTTTGDKLFPEVTFTVVAQCKTAINGTYDILRGDIWRGAKDVVDIEGAYPATVIIQHMDTQGNYSIEGSFVGIDGIAYYFDAEVQVKAVDLNNDLAEIKLDESSQPNSVEDIHAATATTEKILQNGELIIVSHGNKYRVDGRRE